MTIQEAKEIERILKSIETFKGLSDRIHAHFKKGEHKDIANMALEMTSELLRIYEDKLAEFPSKTPAFNPSLNGG